MAAYREALFWTYCKHSRVFGLLALSFECGPGRLSRLRFSLQVRCETDLPC